jgi:hypothetical protein
MLPQKRIEPEENAGGRGGFEVRVIGARAPSVAAGTNEGIEIGINIGSRKAPDSARALDEDVPVHRLEAPAEDPPARVKATSEVGPPVPRVSRRKGKGRGMKHLNVWMGAASCLIAVAAVVAKLAARSEPAPAPVQATAKPVISDPVERERLHLFDNFGTLSTEAERLLKRYAAAGSAGEALSMIRNSAGLADRFSAGWQPWGSAAASPWEGPLEPAVDEISPQPAIIIRGVKDGARPFQYYFVRESGHLRIDWEASEGRGDCTIRELEAGAAATEAVVRANISPATFFTPAFPESSFRSYQLADLPGGHVVWAFVPVESESAGLLKRTLNEDSLILSTGAASKVTLKVTRQPVEDANVFLITEILHNGWVSP